MNDKDINKMFEDLINNIRTELQSIKSEITADFKDELNDVKTDLHNEINDIKSGMQDEIENIKSNMSEEMNDIKHSRTPEFIPPDFPFPSEGLHIGAIFDTGFENTKDFDISNFSKIHIGGSFKAEITQSDVYKVSITARDPLFRNLDVSRDGDVLKIGHSRHIGWKTRLSRPTVRITLPALKELSLSGATNATINGFSSTEMFKLEMSGAAGIDGDITAGSIDFELSGASHARLTGSAKDAILKASGANQMDLRGFSIENAAVRLSGACNCTAKVSGRLDVRLSGASNFSWIGDPVIGDIRTSGASRLRKE
jgi:hypothetical protein